MTTMLALTSLKRDDGLQPRAQLNEEVLTDYQDLLTAWDRQNPYPLPPVEVIYNGTTHWLTDGYHRAEAAKRAGFTEIPASITPGNYRDAILASCKANATHGLRRTNDDKHRQVLRLLNDSEWRRWSDRQIAKHCLVNNHTVAKLRATLTGEIPSDPQKLQQNRGGDTRTFTNKHGSTSTMSTANIGKGRAKPTLQLGKTIYQFLANNHPVTVQQVYDGLVKQGIIARNDDNYAAVKEMIGGMYESGNLESDWIIDDRRPILLEKDSPQVSPPSSGGYGQVPVPARTDALGRIIPPECLPLFDQFIPHVKHIRQLLIQAREEWNGINDSLPMSVKGFKGYSSVKGALEKEIPYLINLFLIALPYTTCIYCKGKDTNCRVCGDSHAITKEAFDRAPQQLQPEGSLTLKELNAKEGVAA